MCRNVHRDNTLQSLDVGIVASALVIVQSLAEFLTHISTLVLVGNLNLTGDRILEAKTAIDNLVLHFVFRLAQSIGNILHVNTSVLVHAGNDGILHVMRLRLLGLLNHTLAEDVTLAEMLGMAAFLVAHVLVCFKREHIRIVNIPAEECQLCILVEVAVGSYKVIVCLVELIKQRFQSLVALILRLVCKHIIKR